MPTFDKSFGFQGPQGLIGWRDGLRLTGALLGVEIGVPAGIVALLEKEGKPIPPPAIGAALIDTGAAGCVIDSAAAESLGLMPVDMVQVLGVSAPELRPTYGSPVQLSRAWGHYL